ncbi:MAG: N-6 DNA methylase [Mannheimia varigena]|nr:N-6 DNA methylase [Mannheimia varigena]
MTREGTGGFLVTAMNLVIEQLKQDWATEFGDNEHEWGDDAKKALQQRISEAAASSFFGFDIAPELVKATKMNMVMNNDGSGNILRNDSLMPPHLWDEDFKTTLANALKIDSGSLKSHHDIGLFDVIVTNPPFGSKITIQQEYMLNQYQIGHGWISPKNKNNTTQTWLKKADTSPAPPEQLFLERCLQFLKPAGRMVIVLPDNILGAPGLGYIRQWLLTEAKIIASIDLDSNTFQPHTGVQTSILILQKKTEAEKLEDLKGGMQPYNIFMAQVDRVGHDKRGVNTYVRDDNGDEILVENGKTNADGKPELDKVPDDQTLDIPALFEAWKREEGLAW